MNEIITQTITSAMHLAIIAVVSVATFYMKTAVIPWLKDKQIYSTVQKYVRAAEKLASTGKIPKSRKKTYVCGLLGKAGITVTPEIETLIEAAVEETDEAAVGFVAELIEGKDDETAE